MPFNLESFIEKSGPLPLGRGLMKKCFTGAKRMVEIRSNILWIKERIESVGAWSIGLYPDVLKAVYLTWGAAAEFTTLTGYTLMARRTTNPVLKEVMTRIGRDERKHFAFYFNEAEDALSKNRWVQELSFQVLNRLWTPVGTGVKPQEEVDWLMTFLAEFNNGEGESMLLEIDRTMGKLPGMKNFSRMRYFMDQLGILNASPDNVPRSVPLSMVG